MAINLPGSVATAQVRFNKKPGSTDTATVTLVVKKAEVSAAVGMKPDSFESQKAPAAIVKWPNEWKKEQPWSVSPTRSLDNGWVAFDMEVPVDERSLKEEGLKAMFVLNGVECYVGESGVNLFGPK
jgi:hypothetical protein